MTVADLQTARGETESLERHPVRVCHVSLTLKTGGLERLLADIARHHHPGDCIPEFGALREVGRFADEIRTAGCTVHELNASGRLGQIRQMVRLFRTGRYDVVHTHNTYPHIHASIAARLAGVPVVVNTRHGQRSGHGWKSRVQFRWASMLVDRIIAVSDDAAQLCIHADGIVPRKVMRIWNGIDLDDFQFTGPKRAPMAISVARLSAEKDFPSLLHAVALVLHEVPDFRLILVGDGPERQNLQKLANELNIADHIDFLGERKDVPALLTQAGFFVTASLTEGISLTLLEAMAVGLPVVATSVGGNSEIVDAPRTGQLVPAGDVTRLANEMISMLHRQDEWMDMGRAGRDRVAEHFEVRRMVSDYENLYRELLAAKV